MDQNTIQDFLKEVQEFGCNAINVSKKLLEDGKENVTLELIRKRVMPERMESPARAHVFYNAESFCSYLRDPMPYDKSERMIVFADIEQSVIYAVLNDEAEKGFEVITLQPPYHPEFKLLWQTLLDQDNIGIFEFARSMMRNRSILEGGPEKTMQLALLMQQITVSSNIKAYVGVGSRSVNGIMCTTEAKAGRDEAQIDLPDSIEVKVPIYIDTDPVSFGIDITITADRDGKVLVTTDNPEVQVRKYEVFNDILEYVKSKVGILVTLGRPDTKEWAYNK
jgi:hypothetical protein